MCCKFDAESLGSVMEAAGRLQIGVFASGPLQEAALLQHSALQVRMSTPQLLHVVASHCVTTCVTTLGQCYAHICNLGSEVSWIQLCLQ